MSKPQEKLGTKRNIFIWQGRWRGGAEQVTFQIAQYLQEHEDASVVLGVFADEEQSGADFRQVAVRRLFPKRLTAFNNIWASIVLAFEAARYDFVLTHAAGFWGWRGAKVVYREPGDLRALMRSKGWLSKVVYWLPFVVAKRMVRRVDVVVAASRAAVDFCASVGRSDVVFSQNFFSTSALSDVELHNYDKKDSFKVVFIGRDDRLKRLAVVRDVVEELSETERIALHVFGAEGESTDNVIFRGWKDVKDVHAFLCSGAHAFVLASTFEASPLSLLEALLTGVPSIVSESACPEEYLADVNIFVTEDQLREQLLTLMHSYDVEARRSYKAAQSYRKTHGVTHVLSTEFASIFSRL